MDLRSAEQVAQDAEGLKVKVEDAKASTVAFVDKQSNWLARWFAANPKKGFLIAVGVVFVALLLLVTHH